jgi:membrane protein
MIRLKNLWKQLREAYKLLVNNDPLRLAGATAFFTTFALPPILLILIQLLSLMFNRREISHELFQQLGGLVGRESTRQLIATLRGLRNLADTWTAAILGFIFLGFVATTLFKVIQSSFNQLWMIRRTGNKKITMAFRGRIKSVLAIVFTGLLFLATLLTESLRTLFGKYITELTPGMEIFFNGIISILLSVLIVWTWFAVMFHYLADGRPVWKATLSGALLTSLLFNIGKYLLRWLLPKSNIGLLYGASGSIVLLLLFVFYSSLILYYGAAFTKVWSDHIKRPIEPMRNAMCYDTKEL